MSKTKTKAPESGCPKPELMRAPTRAWQGSFNGPDEAGSLASGTSFSRKVGTEYDKSGEAEREFPPADDMPAYPIFTT